MAKKDTAENGGKVKRSRKANAEPAGGGAGGWADPTIYYRKTAAERKAGRKLTMAEFRSDEHWTPPPAEEAIGKVAADPESASQTGTSIFDPVLCELVYRWFCPPKGLVLDPFAGGSVRGIVASKLQRLYFGVDLSDRQIAANEAQAKAICDKRSMPHWIVGDSIDLHKCGLRAERFDLVFSCPPYADLEVYSEDARDLSVMEHKHFLHAYFRIIENACELLRDDRFACFVVGDARDEKGNYYGLPWRTVEAFKAAGLGLYNSAVLVTAAGSLPVRVAKQFTASRKLGTTHQHVFVFLKGDARKATAAIGEVEFGDVEGLVSAAAPAPSVAAFGGAV